MSATRFHAEFRAADGVVAHGAYVCRRGTARLAFAARTLLPLSVVRHRVMTVASGSDGTASHDRTSRRHRPF